MNVEQKGGTVNLELTAQEAHLLRRALERALFIDTPVAEQSDILSFCTRALEALPPDHATR